MKILPSDHLLFGYKVQIRHPHFTRRALNQSTYLSKLCRRRHSLESVSTQPPPVPTWLFPLLIWEVRNRRRMSFRLSLSSVALLWQLNDIKNPDGNVISRWPFSCDDKPHLLSSTPVRIGALLHIPLKLDDARSAGFDAMRSRSRDTCPRSPSAHPFAGDRLYRRTDDADFEGLR